MAKLTMKEIKELARKRNENSGKKDFKDSDIYPFWLMEPGQEAVVRFLPDKNKDNPLPFVEKLEHKLPIGGQKRKIACPKMYGHACPICDKSKDYYDAEGDDSENGKYYYRDRMHLARALILEDPLPLEDGEEPRVGTVKKIQVGFQLHEKIMEQLGTFFEDDDPIPWGLDDGYEFKIIPVMQGKYKKYDLSSTFKKSPSKIPEEYLENINIIDLEELLPEETTYDQANEFYAQHVSGGVNSDPDSLESKKASSNSSARKNALARMKGDDGDDDAEELDDDTRKELADTVKSVQESSSDDDSGAEESADDDDDDDDDELAAIIARSRKKNKDK